MDEQQTSYRKGSDNFNTKSNTFFNNVKSISTTPSTEQQAANNNTEYKEIDDNASTTSTTATSISSPTTKPKTLIDGAFRGALAFGGGILSGAKGVIAEPIKGAKAGGFSGFGKGLAKGVSGVVVLPVVGLFEFVSLTTQGIYNTPITILDAMKNAPKEEEEMVTILAEAPKLFFAIDLKESLKNANEQKVPHLLKVCIEFISKRLNVEGIFRVSGSKSLIDEIQTKFDQGLIKSVQDDLDEHWIYEICSIMKAYFRYLPESIIPEEQIKELYRIQNNITDPVEKASALKQVVNSIPEPNYTIVYQCLSLLHEISLNSKENLMTTSNISIVFGPSWLRPDITLGVQEIANANTIIYNLISFFQQIFIKKPDSTILNIEKPQIHIKPMIQK